MGKEVVVSGWEWGWFKVGKLSTDTPCVTLNFSIHPHNWPNENTQWIVFPSWHSDMSRRFSEAFFHPLPPFTPCTGHELLCVSVAGFISFKSPLLSQLQLLYCSKRNFERESCRRNQSLTSRAWSCGIDVVNQPDSLFRRQKTAGTFHRVYLAIMFLNW